MWDVPGASATRRADADASRFPGPTTKLSNANLGSRSVATTALLPPPSRYAVVSCPLSPRL
jgi:hypothetical protein